MSLSETPRTDLAIVTATTQGKKYVNASFCRTLERELDEALSALKIIHTWSTFETKNNPKGHALVPDTVSKLCIKTLKRSSTATSPWQDNTMANPFWIGSETSHGEPGQAVEVMFKNGKTKRLPCPKCARGMFNLVVKWRKFV